VQGTLHVDSHVVVTLDDQNGATGTTYQIGSGGVQRNNGSFLTSFGYAVTLNTSTAAPGEVSVYPGDGWYNVTVNGGQGSQALAVEDTEINPLNPNIYYVDSDKIEQTYIDGHGFLQPDFLYYNNLGSLELDTSTSAVINVDGTPAPTTIVDNEKLGSQVYLAPASSNLDNLGNAVTVHGSGATTLAFHDETNDDQAGLAYLKYTLTSTSFDRSVINPMAHVSMAIPQVKFDGIGKLDLYASELGGGGGQYDQVDVQSTSATAQTTIWAQNDVTTVDVGPDLNNVPQLTVAGAGAHAVLTVDDSADTTGGSYVIDGFSATLSRNQQTISKIVYVTHGHTFGEIDLKAGQGPNQILVTGSSSATTNIGAGSSGDVVTIGNGVIEEVAGNVIVDAHGGKLILDDHSAPANLGQISLSQTHTYSYDVADTLASQAQNQGAYNTVKRTDHIHEYEWWAQEPPSAIAKHLPNPYIVDFYVSQLFSYTNVGTLTLAGGQSNVTFNVQSTPQGTPVTINTNAVGKQTVNVGLKGSVKGIASALAISGQGGNTSVIADDSASASPDLVHVVNGQTGDVQVGMAALDQFFASQGSMDLIGVGALTLDLSNAAGDFVHLAASAKTAFTINGNASQYQQVAAAALLDIDLGGATDAVLTTGLPGSGKWSFKQGSHQTISYTNMKMQAH
jgi:hypothetical protein